MALAAVTAAVGRALGIAGLPSPYLFGALLVGLAVALLWPDRMTLSDPAFAAAQALMGVTLGCYLQSSSLSDLGDQWLPVTLVSAGTLVVSLAAGSLLARFTTADPPTAALGMIAGGASGIVAMAEDLGADDRLVAFMQYLRVLVIVLLTPVIVAIAFPGHATGGAGGGHDAVFGDLRGWILTLAIATAGGLAAAGLRIPAGALLGPMIVAAVVVLAIPGGRFAIPPILRESSFALIGLRVGLRFTTATVREVGRLLLPVIVSIIGLIVASFGLAAALAATTSVSLLDAYLATTPGGLYAVLGVAFGAGADTTFIIAVQGLRLLVMVLLAPLAVRRLVGGKRSPEPVQPAVCPAREPESVGATRD